MKKLIILLILAMAVTGCVSISFNPETGYVTYTRIGEQHIQGFELKRNEDGGFKVKLEGQQAAESTSLIETLKVVKALTEVAK